VVNVAGIHEKVPPGYPTGEGKPRIAGKQQRQEALQILNLRVIMKSQIVGIKNPHGRGKGYQNVQQQVEAFVA